MTNLISKAFEGHNIRIITSEHGEPWFVAADIAKVLEYLAAKDMTRLLDDDEKGRQIVPTLGGNQEMNTINESGPCFCVPQNGGAQILSLGGHLWVFHNFVKKSQSLDFQRIHISGCAR